LEIVFEVEVGLLGWPTGSVVCFEEPVCVSVIVAAEAVPSASVSAERSVTVSGLSGLASNLPEE